MRLITVTFVALFGLALFAGSGRIALAQMPPATAPAVSIPARPNSAVEGTIASLDSRGAMLQTADGQSVRLAMVPRGYLLVDPSPQALSAGMRVFALGYPQPDGAISVVEIDVLVPLSLLTVVPPTAQR